MQRTSPAYPPEFKAEAIRLVHSSEKSIPTLAKDLGVSDPTLRNWVRQAEIDTGTRAGLTSSEREELARLRREVRILKQEREILKKAAAFFAKESDAIRSRCSRSLKRGRRIIRSPSCADCSVSRRAAITRGGNARRPLVCRQMASSARRSHSSARRGRSPGHRYRGAPRRTRPRTPPCHRVPR